MPNSTGPANTISVVIYDGSWVYANDTTTAATDTWVHIMGTYDGSNLKLFVNGEQVDSDPHTTDMIQSPISMKIGEDHHAGANVTGQLDEVRIYNYALTAEQVKTDYTQGAASFR